MNLNNGYVRLIDQMVQLLLTNLRARLHYRAQSYVEIRGMV